MREWLKRQGRKLKYRGRKVAARYAKQQLSDLKLLVRQRWANRIMAGDVKVDDLWADVWSAIAYVSEHGRPPGR